MNLNKVFLIGRLTQDPELRSTPSGQSVATLRMATNRVWNDPSGNKKDATEFHTVVAWGRLGEIANQYLKKGGLVMIEGRIQTRTWTDPNNNKRYFTEVVAEGLQLGPRTVSAGNVVSDIKKDKDDNIPIIDANDPVSSGVEEDEVKIKEEDLPF
ncbi:MAG: hypothetical protein A2655_01200 [Candidatus Yanofskybacteria bacterium RIFCSPHIGHO2_01_FULL_43_42]|uniref:Single-stranded DNA-binding protein n=1 Tax=Candidatus Yanofskybacteria bacterium RIFCSPLOWO2_01_FULL_43_22 TaxID=1802695 RepID=A0A1F8GEI7_9BACT|nr:MAG: hypothetical protein A2655_01200 [Candidatus Yanofskybacteria bacterium RIFCSPHIGHO2_01_FULL_43_42]OGN13812.1 MAG: hypothetical protein A3D48_00475 [Candidatus Yanofskybacteria bacterium RIFCSPHIGHO2_02_FULL_43_17]OGN23795.1 MAG: hypothetical protein A3A13_01990 [Candidatus Yanofskybacteria bacterium RIFCSPLOWO2_01_FULL_43_22]